MATFRNTLKAACLFFGMMLLGGCGKEEVIPPAEDLRNADVYGSSIKSQALFLLTQAKRYPTRTAEIGTQLSELLEDSEKRPVGEHAAKYKGLRDGAQELKSLAEKSSPDVKKKLDELQALAESLPGSVKVVGDDPKAKSGDVDQ